MKHIKTVFVILILSVGITGCNGSDSSNRQKTPVEQDTLAETPVPDEPVSVPTVEKTDASTPKLYKWQEAFCELLSSGFKEEESEYGSPQCYYICDVDHVDDQIPELIVKFGQDEATYWGIVYKFLIAEERIEKVFDFPMGHTVLYSDSNGDLLQCMSHMGEQTIFRIQLKDDRVFRYEDFQNVFDEETGEKVVVDLDEIYDVSYLEDNELDDLSGVKDYTKKQGLYSEFEKDTTPQTLIDKYLYKGKDIHKGDLEADKNTKPLPTNEFLEAKTGQDIQVYYDKLVEEWLSGNISIPFEGEYSSYNPDPQYFQIKAKYDKYDINLDGLDEFLLIVDDYGEPQISVFKPFELRIGKYDGANIYPNYTCNYVAETENGNILVCKSGWDYNTHYTIIKFDNKNSYKFEFSAIANVETGEIAKYEVVVNGIETIISEEEYLELKTEAENYILKCKTFGEGSKRLSDRKIPDKENNNKNKQSETTGKKTDSDSKISLKKAKDSLVEINKALQGFIWTELWASEADSFSIRFSDAEKIRAAALASREDDVIDAYFSDKGGKVVLDKNAEAGPYGNGFHGKSVSKTDVEQNCLDLFGTKADWNAFQTKEKCSAYDAVKYIDDKGVHAVVLDWETETEIDQKSQSYKIKESDGKFTGEVELYWGYWGDLANDPGLSNYTLSYVLRPNDTSKYGLVVSTLSVKKRADMKQASSKENSLHVDEPVVSNNVGKMKPFFGIWCSASKNLTDAQNEADKLTAKGFNGQVFVSSEWKNMNRDKWYVVTSGSYTSEQSANAELQKVKNAGYPDAYVKYTGDYIGE